MFTKILSLAIGCSLYIYFRNNLINITISLRYPFTRFVETSLSNLPKQPLSFKRNCVCLENACPSSDWSQFGKFTCCRNPNEQQEIDHARQDKARFKNVEWTAYEEVHKKYLNLGECKWIYGKTSSGANHFRFCAGHVLPCLDWNTKANQDLCYGLHLLSNLCRNKKTNVRRLHCFKVVNSERYRPDFALGYSF